MKTSLTYTALFSSLLMLFPVQTGSPCGYFLEEDEWYYRPFSQYVIDLPEYSPFFYTYHYSDWTVMNTDDGLNRDFFSDKRENLQDWQRYYGNAIPIEHIEAIVYSDKLQLTSLLSTIKKNRLLSAKWADNKLAERWKSGTGLEELEYLIFAHEVVPLVQEPDWWEEEEKDIPTMLSKRDEAVQHLQLCGNTFIRLRYAFQAMRLSHYTGNYADCLLMFEQEVKNADKQSAMYWWCMYLKAGAHHHQGEYASAAYNNSLVFSHSAAKRIGAERDFYVDTNSNWERALSMCRDREEQKNLWMLAGISQENAAFTSMQALWKLDPASWQLEMLLAREVEKYQRNHMPERGLWFTDERSEWLDPISGSDETELLPFIQQGIRSGQARTPGFWMAAEGLIHFLANRPGDCKQVCEQALATEKDPALIAQLHALLLMNEVRQLTSINPTVEKKILPGLLALATRKDLHGNDAYRLIMHQLTNLYVQQDDIIRAEICLNQARYTDIYDLASQYPVDDMMAFYSQKDISDFDQFLIGVYPYQMDEFLELKGTQLMRNYEWDAALSIFNQLEGNRLNHFFMLKANPFVMHLNDCHDCDQWGYDPEYSKADFCRKMIGLHEEFKQSGNTDPQVANALGNAYYNISYFGNCWQALNYYRNTTFFGYWGWGDEDDTWRVPGEDPESVFDNTMAQTYYDIAAKHSTDKEFQALNIFMMAKCEQNTLYLSGLPMDTDTYASYRSNFATLQKGYASTTFYQQAINECKFFDYYVSTH